MIIGDKMSKSSQISFRAACRPEIGTGHLRRCITLANFLRNEGHSVRVTTDDSPLARKIGPLYEGDVSYLSPGRLLGSTASSGDVLVLDAPRKESAYLNRDVVLEELATLDEQGVSIVSLGHVARTAHYFRLVVDLYPSRKIHAANYLAGPDYLILRPEFSELDSTTVASADTVFVCMGGSDPHNLTLLALEVLSAAGFNGTVRLVLGAGYPEDREQKLQTEWPFEVDWYRNVSDIIRLMRGCGLALVAFGTTAYELMSQGVPVVAFTHYRWQEPSANLFEELGCCVHLGCAEDRLDASSLGTTVREMLDNEARRTDVGRRGREEVDGKGAERVAGLITDLAVEDQRQLDTLYILAHPGDELLGCGGTLIKQIDNGSRVGVMVLGEGVSSRHRDTEGRVSTMVARRELRSSLQTVVDELDIPVWYYYQFADNRFDQHDLLDFIKVIESVLTRHRPRVVYTHHPGDLNIDHRRTYEAVITALRPMSGQATKKLLSIEVPSSTDWGSVQHTDSFSPNWFVDIRSSLDRKLELLKNYESELREEPHPRSIQALRERARHWGRFCGVEAAEAFVLQRYVETENEVD